MQEKIKRDWVKIEMLRGNSQWADAITIHNAHKILTWLREEYQRTKKKRYYTLTDIEKKVGIGRHQLRSSLYILAYKKVPKVKWKAKMWLGKMWENEEGKVVRKPRVWQGVKLS